MYTVEYFETERGNKQVESFIKGLDPKMKVKVMRQIDLLREFGPNLCEPYSRQIDRGICELRVQQSSNITRIFYFFYCGNTIVLTNGFVKKTQRTPVREIDRAKRYKAEYEKRRDLNG